MKTEGITELKPARVIGAFPNDFRYGWHKLVFSGFKALVVAVHVNPGQ